MIIFPVSFTQRSAVIFMDQLLSRQSLPSGGAFLQVKFIKKGLAFATLAKFCMAARNGSY